MKWVITIVVSVIWGANNGIDCSTLSPEDIKLLAEQFDVGREKFLADPANMHLKEPVGVLLSELRSNPQQIPRARFKKAAAYINKAFQNIITRTFKSARELSDKDIKEILKYREEKGMYGSRAALWKEYDDIFKSHSSSVTKQTNLKEKLRAKALKGKTQQGVEEASTSRAKSPEKVGVQQSDEDIDQYMKRMGLEEEKRDEEKSVQSEKSKGKTGKKSKGGKDRT